MMRSMLFTVLAAATVAAAQSTGAQSAETAPAPDAPVCLGFAFGAFTPRLDWAKAGHAPIRDSSAFAHAPAGRDWATDQAMPNDSSLYLFPSWWPVGVYIELATRRPAPGDTVSGRATALVASGRITPPVAKVKAWRVPCGGAPTRAPNAVRSDSAGERPRPHTQSEKKSRALLEPGRIARVYFAVRPIDPPQSEEVIHCLLTYVRRGSPGAAKAFSKRRPAFAPIGQAPGALS